MFIYFFSFVFAVLSVCLTIYIMGYTNKQIAALSEEEILDYNKESWAIKKYNRTKITYIGVALLFIASLICGYVISNSVTSVIAGIEITICYYVILAAAIIDFRIKRIPNLLSVILIVSRLLILIYEVLFVEEVVAYLVSSLIGCFLSGLMLIFANRLSKGGIGAGDIKLLSCLGLMCGLYVVFSTLLIALVLCILASLFLLIMKKSGKKEQIPFGPFIYFGYLIMCIFTLY